MALAQSRRRQGLGWVLGCGRKDFDPSRMRCQLGLNPNLGVRGGRFNNFMAWSCIHLPFTLRQTDMEPERGPFGEDSDPFLHEGRSSELLFS